MKELNHNTLRDALHALPTYEPPFGLWDEIELALDAEDALTESVQALPQYEPPDALWQHLEARLDAAEVRKTLRMEPLLRPLRRRQWWAAAAAVALLAAAWWLLRPAAESEQMALHISQEALNTEVQNAAQEAEDAGFSLVAQLCQSQAPVCEEPDFKALKSELDDLSAAKAELRNALGQYGDDPTLAAQLVQIERERSDVLRQMMQMI
jgi:hypothetical protein